MALACCWPRRSMRQQRGACAGGQWRGEVGPALTDMLLAALPSLHVPPGWGLPQIHESRKPAFAGQPVDRGQKTLQAVESLSPF